MNKIKKPAWVLFDQLHVDVTINTRMNVQDRNKLRKSLDSKPVRDAIVNAVLMNGPVPPTEKLQVRVEITR